ncbi:MAG: acyltransferase, partial [Clostridiales bacterium]|nr:acyltransferase [Clostridiales bacterium]
MENKRNFGIDLLRMVSMTFIVIMHLLGQGGVIGASGVGPNVGTAAWVLEICAFCAVNIYALISGYVGADSKFKLSRLIVLWLEVVFYTVLITAVVSFIKPEAITEWSWTNAFLPVSNSQYWYITAYFGMSLFAPLINLGVKNASKRLVLVLCFIDVIAFMVVPCFMQIDVFNMKSGYSMLWLLILYFFGAAIKKLELDKKVSPWISAFTYIFSSFLTWMLFRGGNSYLINYISPLMFTAALGIVTFFAGLDIKTKPAKAIIALLSPGSLAVYLIHVHPLIWDNYVKGIAVPYVNHGWFVMVLSVIGTACAAYIVGALFDRLRILLFDLIGLKKLFSKLDDFLFTEKN